MSAHTHGWIRVRGLEVHGTRVGIYAHELTGLQHLAVDVALWTDVLTAAESQRIEDTIDYDRVAAEVREVCTAQPWRLVEAVCEAIAHRLLARFPSASTVSVEVHKPSALADGRVSVAVERTRR